MSVQVTTLFQAKCDDRSVVTLIGVDPMRWIEKALERNTKSVSFHFFMNWNANPCHVVGPLWLTHLVKASNPDKVTTISDDAVLAAFNQAGCWSRLQDLISLANRLSTSAESILLGEIDTRLLSGESPSWLVSLNDEIKQGGHIERITLDGLSKRINSIRGGEASLGSKGLIYGTSAVECWLSKTRNLFPGDCDSLIVKDGCPVALLEMKKHTLSTPISGNLASKYYPKPDGRKYDSLFALKRHIEDAFGYEIPLAVVYYATRFPAFRVQVLQKTQFSIQALRDSGDQDCQGLDEQVIGERIMNEVLI
jgi:hypothetical protein